MKIYFLFTLAFLAAGSTEAKEFDYSRVLMAGTDRVGDLFVRYLYPSEEGCIVIQNLVPGGRGKVSAEKEICSLDGRSFDDYTAVDLKAGNFKDGKLFLELGVTPLQPVGETVKTCEVVFHGGVADHLSCKEKLTKENGACNSEALDSRVPEPQPGRKDDR
ncbi:hypothetical protein NVV94_08745 [Pseudomonas sp. LS1212]|uniref:hypothetical protein n=1 Tax=Pseudomonas sp. LS1212 TaxID=2972478 RepID=UPI00215C2FB3|nr:hypothetical protein [Pseudomonas sp. LS1212]UVJ45621.1 hypothetical protein NVV94_08745 [Pseudomonas sp. LS1212]